MTATVHPIQQPAGRDIEAIKRRLKTFVETRLGSLPQVDQFVLYHEVDPRPQPETPLHVRKNEGGKKKLDAEEVAAELFSVAEIHFDSFGGPGQRYRVSAERKGKEGFEILQSHFFGIGPPVRLVGEVVAASPKGGKGDVVDILVNMLSARERHIENREKMLIELCQSLADPLQSVTAQHAKLAAEVAMLSERRLEQYAQMESMLSQKAERDLAAMREERAQKRRDDALDKFLKEIAPLVKKHVVGKLLPAATGKGDSATDTQKAPDVASAQQTMREIFKVVGKDAILNAVPKDKHALIDDLVGVGKDPKSLAEVRAKLAILWDEIPEEVDNAMQEKLVTERPDLLQQFVAITTAGEVEAEAEAKGDEPSKE